MIVLAKFSLFVLWTMTFVVTCLVMALTFPLIMLFDRFQTITKEVSL